MAFPAFIQYLCLSFLLVWTFPVNGANDSVGFENTSMTVPENIGQVTFCVSFYPGSFPLVRGRVFTINPNKDDPVNSVGNFSDNSLELHANRQRQCFNASVLDNSIVEFGKIYFLNVTKRNPLTTVAYREGERTLKITITNDDTVLIGFSQTSLTVSESDGYASVCMNRVGEARNLGQEPVPPGALSVRLSTVDGTATKDEDFTPLDSMVVDFGLNETFKCINVSLNNDKDLENMDTFYITMTNGSSFVMVNETRSNLTVNIRNDDKVSIGFSQTSITVSESDGYASVCMNRVGEARNLGQGPVPAAALSVRLSTVDGTASRNEDFTPLDSMVVDFGLNETFKCIHVSLNNDNILENMETFYITMTNGSSFVMVNGTRSRLTVNIRNDDKVTAQFEAAYNKEIRENFEEGEVELVCVIDHAARIPVQIGFSVDNFTSTAVIGSDFTLENKSLTFPPNQKKMTLKIKINRDGQAESTEILVVRMVSLDGNLVIGKNDTAKVKITDQMDNDNEAARLKDLENGRRSEIYTLLIVAIVLIAVLFICGIVFCICFIKSRAN